MKRTWTRTLAANAGALLGAGTALAAAGAATLVYAHEVEPRWLETRRLTLRLPRLDRPFDGFRIAQFSDLHMEMWRDWDLLARVIDEANAFEPDVVVITGDFVHEDVADVDDALAEALGRLRPREATLAIMGNHDHWCDVRAVRRMVARAGLRELRNSVCTIHRDGAALHFAGLDSFAEALARFDDVLRCLPAEGAAILLVHEPDFAFVAGPTHRFDLQLSGHSHGGQVRVPILMDMVLPRFAHHFVLGLDTVRGMKVYTNRGLGMSGVKLRFNCRPELTLFTLRSGQP